MDDLLGNVIGISGMAGGTRRLNCKRMRAENVAPSRISRRTLEKVYLCLGEHSPCHRCEAQCHYGRLYLTMKAKGTKKDG